MSVTLGPKNRVGPAGKDGKQGERGERGPKGDKGDKGDRGATGPRGAGGAQGIGVPSGGTTNQVLKKLSNADYDTAWGAGGGTPAGSDTQVQFNDGGAFGADSTFTFNKTTKVLTANEFQVGAAYPIKTLSNSNEIVIGSGAAASITGTTDNMVIIGVDAGASSDNSNGTIMIGQLSGSGADGFGNSVAIGYNSSSGVQSSDGVVAIGSSSASTMNNCTGAIAIGSSAMSEANGSISAMAFGANAGLRANACTFSLMFGNGAGYESVALSSTLMIGGSTGAFATYDYNGPEQFGSVFIGAAAGAYSVNSYETIAIGATSCASHTGYRVIGLGPFSFATSGVTNSIGVGQYSFEQCATGDNNLGFGDYTFNYATNPQSSVAVGPNAGSYSSNATSCLFIGPSAGNASVDLTSALGIGDSALKSATSAPSSVAIGTLSLFGVLGAQATVAIGNNAGGSEFGGGYVNSSVFVGSQSGYQAYNGSDCIFIGSNSGLNDTVDNYTTYGWNIILGSNTNTGGFSNSIAIGGWIANSAASQCNIGNALYIDGIYTTASQSATPIGTAKVGINTDTPDSELQVIGRTHTDTLQINGGSEATNLWTVTATLDFPNIAHNTSEELTVTVTGAAVGDTVMLGAPSTIEAGLIFCGYVSATDTVTIRVHNSTGGAVDPASNDWRVTVLQFT
jgi:hypothetical protein